MKTKLLNITILIMSITALLELAMSQVHIKTITKLFSAEVGFYLFLFIIFGLVTLFNLTSVKQSTNNMLLIFSTVVVIAAGLKYVQLLLNDYKVYDNIVFLDIKYALYLAIAGIVVYGLGTIVVVLSKPKVKAK
jgi:Na+-translocating ferredoxin:NAD+ oxidoreductase RnfE subunit